MTSFLFSIYMLFLHNHNIYYTYYLLFVFFLNFIELLYHISFYMNHNKIFNFNVFINVINNSFEKISILQTNLKS